MNDWTTSHDRVLIPHLSCGSHLDIVEPNLRFTDRSTTSSLPTRTLPA
ncbi:hypothetical protein [Streptomyces sp. NPDC058240]